MSVSSLSLRLTAIDRRVLNALPGPYSPGERADTIGLRVYAATRSSRGATAEQQREVREILNGLECVGLARQANGWWRRA